MSTPTIHPKAPDFKPASTKTTPPTHILLLDFHTQTTPTPSQTSHQTLRHATTRLLQNLFTTPPPTNPRTNLTILLVSPLQTPTTIPTLSLLTSTPALTTIRNLPPAQTRLRHASRTTITIPPTITPIYAQSLITALHHRIPSPASLTLISTDLALATAHSIAHSQLSVPFASTITIHPIQHASLAQFALDEVVARAHETLIRLTLPSCVNIIPSNNASSHAPHVLTLACRPRVLPDRDASAMHAPLNITATRLVPVESLPEDVVTGLPFVVWSADEGNRFRVVCRALREIRVGLVCLVGAGYGGFVVVFGGKGGMGLLKGVAHAHSLLPVPRAIGGPDEVEEGELGEDGSLLEKAGLESLAVGRYDARGLRLEQKVKKVNFCVE